MMRNLKIYIFRVIHKRYEVGGTCGMHAGKKKNVQSLEGNMK
jgi:hypothetical protein